MKKFTLVEILVVIAVIGILASLILPAVTGANQQTMRLKAKADVSNIMSAIVKYESTYGKLPILMDGTKPNSKYFEDGDEPKKGRLTKEGYYALIQALSGVDLLDDSKDVVELGDDYNTQSNPMDYVNSVINTLNNTRTMINTYAQYDIIDGLNFKTSFNLDDTRTDKNIFYPASIAAGAATNGRGTNAWAKRRNWSWENILTYDKSIKKKHNINIMLGYTMEKQTGRNFSIESRDYLDIFASLPGGNVGHGATTLAPVVSEFSSALISYLSRINYSYKGKYLFTVSLRSDGSSKFPKGEKFSYFPSAAFAWNILIQI